MVKHYLFILFFIGLTALAAYQRINYGVADNWVLFLFVGLFLPFTFSVSYITEWSKKRSN